MTVRLGGQGPFDPGGFTAADAESGAVRAAEAQERRSRRGTRNQSARERRLVSVAGLALAGGTVGLLIGGPLLGALIALPLAMWRVMATRGARASFLHDW